MSDHVSNFTKADDQIILDLINHDNESTLTLAQVALGEPLGNPSTQEVSLTVSPQPNSGYTDTVDVTYNRLDIQAFMDIFFPDGMVLQQGDAVTIADLLDEVNVALGAAIAESHIVDGPIGEWEGTANETKEILLVIANNCRTYFGQATLTLDGNDIPMEEAIHTKTLSGLNLPEGEGGEPTPTARVFSFPALTMTAGDEDEYVFEGQSEVPSDNEPTLTMGYLRALVVANNPTEGSALIALNFKATAGSEGEAILRNPAGTVQLSFNEDPTSDYAVQWDDILDDGDFYRQANIVVPIGVVPDIVPADLHVAFVNA